MTLSDICERIYSKRGQYAVMDFITAYLPEIEWDYCEPCEIVSPVDRGCCLVCGSVI